MRNFLYEPTVNHTSVKDQGQVGFCWSYAVSGHIEGNHLRRTGNTVDLSEEWTGFWAIYDQVIKNAPEYFRNEKRKVDKSKKGFKKLGNKISTKTKNLVNLGKIHFFFSVSEGAPDMMQGVELVKKYGVVPESVFSYKIVGDEAQKGVESRVMSFVHDELRDPDLNPKFRLKNADGTLSDQPEPIAILERLAQVYVNEKDGPAAGKASQADKILNAHRNGFIFEGVHVTPIELVARMNFDVDNYHQTKVNQANFDQTIQRIEQALAAGEQVPIGILLMTGYAEAIKGSGILTPESCGLRTPCGIAGGHAILVVGKTTDPQTGQTNGLIIKNSWGAVGLNQSGSKTGATGYQVLTLDYLRENYGPHAGERAAEWMMVVPKSI
ncbi:MAG: hypothetical protein JNL01_07035 [Bdellovibrionales bacterium]|nr:hypothetical protein [Bdellovibrionales bacterium]